MCSEYNHVRTWSVTRFRGMISTQPGSTPLASFKIMALEDLDPHISYSAGNDFGKLLKDTNKFCYFFYLFILKLKKEKASI